MDNHFGIAGRAEYVPAGFELGTQLPKVVNFPVKGDPDGPIFVTHRLTCHCTQINNRQPPMRQTDVPIHPDALTIRTTMLQCLGHPLKLCTCDCPLWIKVDLAADTAHDPILFPWKGF